MKPVSMTVCLSIEVILSGKETLKCGLLPVAWDRQSLWARSHDVWVWVFA